MYRTCSVWLVHVPELRQEVTPSHAAKGEVMKIDYAPLFWGVTIGFTLMRLFDYLAWRIALASGSQEITASEFTAVAMNINSGVMIVLYILAGVYMIVKSTLALREIKRLQKEVDGLLERLGK